MGILDDAIREHLDLKRRLGGDEADLKRLEDEAFGPPVRPGEPEFGGPEAGVHLQDRPNTARADDAGPRPDDWVDAPLEPRRGRSLEPLEEAPPAPPRAADAPLSIEEPPPAPEESAAQRARREHPELGDTAPHHPVLDEETGEASLPREVIPPSEEGPPAEERPPADEPARADGPPGEAPDDAEGADAPAGQVPPPGAPAAPPDTPPSGEAPQAPAEEAGAEGAIFDHESSDELDVGELGLDLDDELEPGPSPEPRPEPAEEPEPAPSPPAPPEPEPEKPAGEDEGEDVGDLLEETPDFLRDAPESDQLWFEQGEPQDFDFDEDE